MVLGGVLDGAGARDWGAKLECGAPSMEATMARVTWILGLLASGAAAFAGSPGKSDDAAAAPHPTTASTARLHAVIDQTLADSWRAHEITPAFTCDDATFLRRLSLDLK